MVKVSIIMPIYNGEAFLETSLSKLLRQTLTDIEILCVDDGSTDGSASILKSFSEKDSRVRVFTQSNAGPGPARNVGLANATGEFIAFMDCDDYYPEDTTLEKLYRAALDHGCAIAAGYRTYLDKDGCHPDYADKLYHLAAKHPRGAVIPYQETQTDFNYQCYLFSHELITQNNITFPDFRRCQDPPFFVRAMIAAKNFYLLPCSSYVYRWGHQNIQWTKRKINDLLLAHMDLLSLSRTHGLGILHGNVASRLESRYRNIIVSNLNRENLELYALLVYANSITDVALLGENHAALYRSLLDATTQLVDVIRLNSFGNDTFLRDCIGQITDFYKTLPNANVTFLNSLFVLTLGKLYQRNQPAYLRHQLLNALSQDWYQGILSDYDREMAEIQPSVEALEGAAVGRAFVEKLAADQDVTSRNCQCIYNSCTEAIPAVSVIVPVYNVAPYLAQCLDSLLNQTCKDWEIICVNDGSTDGSLDILMEYARNHQNFVVLTQVNSGLSAARNSGISYARGEYLHFLDSDDCMKPESYEVLLEKARKKELDLLFFDGESLYEDEKLKEEHSWYQTGYQSKSTGDHLTDGEQYFITTVSAQDFRISACMYLVRREFLNSHSLRFIEGILHEDNYFTCVCALLSQRTSHLTQPLYIRRVARGSLTIRSLSFRHAYGYFRSYWALRNFLENASISQPVKDIASLTLMQMLQNARNEYNKIEDPRERLCYLALPTAEAEQFYLMIVDAMIVNSKNMTEGPTSLQEFGILPPVETDWYHKLRYFLKVLFYGPLVKLHNGIHICLEYGFTHAIMHIFRK